MEKLTNCPSGNDHLIVTLQQDFRTQVESTFSLQDKKRELTGEYNIVRICGARLLCLKCHEQFVLDFTDLDKEK